MSAGVFIVAGALDQPTGGYRYDARILAELDRAGQVFDVVELPGRFPDPDATAANALDHALAGIAPTTPLVIDGLACGGLADIVERHARRLSITVLVHHPLADETGLDPRVAAMLEASERRVLNAASRIVATSGFTARRLAERGLADKPVVVVEPGVSAAPLAAAAAHPPLQLLCVASLIPRKGHTVLVDALARIADLDWRCHCVGDTARDADHAEAIRARITEAGLEPRIHLHGALDEAGLDAAYANADLFVLPSYYEGYGMVITEAIARGVPVLTTTGGALVDTLPPGAGAAVAPGDAIALAERLRGALEDPGQRQAWRAGAVRARRELRDWPNAAREFADVLGSAIVDNTSFRLVSS